MSFQAFVFYALSVILLFSGVRVITAKNPVHAALFLVLAFFTASGHWLLLQSEFLAIALVLVYVGAVMVLFLFVVMMIDIDFDKLREGFWKHLPVAGTVAVIMMPEMALILTSPEVNLSQYGAGADVAADYSNVKDLGRQIYTVYLYPFELAAVLLLVAIVAAIALTMRKNKPTKWVDPAEQVKVRRDDRLRVLKMAAEPRVEVGVSSSADDKPAV